jgi:hypothetical protein
LKRVISPLMGEKLDPPIEWENLLSNFFGFGEVIAA